MCRNLERRKCKFGDNCWYKHTNEIENKNTIESLENSSELIQKLFDMMEKFTQRIMEIAKMMQLEKNHVNDK